MRLFIRKLKKEKLEKLAEDGGGFLTAEVLVVKEDFELMVPDPKEREIWQEFEFYFFPRH